MGLAQEVRAEPPKRWTREIVNTYLGPEEAADLDDVLADPLLVPQRIWLALRARGIGISESAVAKWCQEARR